MEDFQQLWSLKIVEILKVITVGKYTIMLTPHKFFKKIQHNHVFIIFHHIWILN